MNLKILSIICILSFGGLGVALFQSTNSLPAWFRLRSAMKKTELNIRKTEEENAELRRKVDLFQEGSPAAHRYHLRSVLGLVKPGEIVFLEPQD